MSISRVETRGVVERYPTCWVGYTTPCRLCPIVAAKERPMTGYKRWTMALIAAALMAAEADAAAPPSLTDQVRAERDGFRPLSAADLAAARDELNSAVAAVE